jgi:hypothetical protein
MSRVEDDRDAARVQARLAEQKRLEETKRKEGKLADNTFAKLVGEQKQQTQARQDGSVARSAIAQLLAKGEASGALAKKGDGARQADDGAAARQGAQGADARVRQAAGSQSRNGEVVRLKENQGQAEGMAAKLLEGGEAALRSEGRASDGVAGKKRTEERKDANDAKASGRSGAAPQGELKADADKGQSGGGQQGKGGDDKKGAELAAGFRFNPALMAPVPVAKANSTTPSDRLRQIAAEIAQKIVERVRVGTNAAGKSEFQIDLRSNVLSGLSVKVSSSNGKIKALFSGSDRDVLKLLEDNAEALKKALSGRGLALEEFKVEVRG